MAVVFSEGYALPKEFRHDMGAYGSDTNFWDVLASGPNLVKSIFVDKPAAEQAAQVSIAQQQAQAAEKIAADKSATTMTIVKVAGGVLAVLAVGLLLLKLRKKPTAAPAKVAGYRRRHRHSRRSRR